MTNSRRMFQAWLIVLAVAVAIGGDAAAQREEIAFAVKRQHVALVHRALPGDPAGKTELLGQRLQPRQFVAAADMGEMPVEACR